MTQPELTWFGPLSGLFGNKACKKQKEQSSQRTTKDCVIVGNEAWNIENKRLMKVCLFYKGYI